MFAPPTRESFDRGVDLGAVVCSPILTHSIANEDHESSSEQKKYPILAENIKIFCLRPDLQCGNGDFCR